LRRDSKCNELEKGFHTLDYCNTEYTFSPASFDFPCRSVNSNEKREAVRLFPTFLHQLLAAAAVPPVASTSSTMSTR
jgi:hypothetical protein